VSDCALCIHNHCAPSLAPPTFVVPTPQRLGTMSCELPLSARVTLSLVEPGGIQTLSMSPSIAASNP